jgi:anti-sigma factor RsiW
VKNPICWLTQRRLEAYQDGELAPLAQARVRRHVDRCAGCTAELDGLARLRSELRAALAAPAPDVAWDTFWPQVRARLATTPAPAPVPTWRRAWERVVEQPWLAAGSALAAAGLAAVAVLAPWQAPVPGVRSSAPVASLTTAAPVGPFAGVTIPPMSAVAPPHTVVHAVETTDPQSSAMVFDNPDSDMTVVWVFGLEPTTEL